MSTAALTVAEAAQELRVDISSVYRLVHSGALAYKNISTGKRPRIRIPRAALERYLCDEGATA